MLESVRGAPLLVPKLVFPAALLSGRLLIGGMFLVEGASKLMGYAIAQAFMQRYGVPGALLPLVIATEIGAGACLVAGWHTRWAAFLLAAFAVMAALIFHRNLTNPMQLQYFEKDLAIAGGLLALMVAGSGSWSLDGHRSGKMRSED